MSEKKFTAKQGKKVLNDIYFNAGKRNKIKKSSLALQKTILKNTDASVKPLLKEEYKERETNSSWLYVSTTFLKAIKEAENLKYRTTLKNCLFKLYKSKKGKTVVIEDNFFKVWEKRNRTTFIVFPNGLPSNNSKRRCKILREEFKFNKGGYILIDFGKFRQRIVGFNEFSVTFRGAIFKQKIIFKQINKSNENYSAVFK